MVLAEQQWVWVGAGHECAGRLAWHCVCVHTMLAQLLLCFLIAMLGCCLEVSLHFLRGILHTSTVVDIVKPYYNKKIKT